LHDGKAVTLYAGMLFYWYTSNYLLRGGSMTKVYAIANQKGGVGKTTSVVNLATYLAMMGKRVITLDFDPQGDLTRAFGVNPEKLGKHAYHLLIDDEITVSDVLLFEPSRKVALIPTNIDLSGAEADFVADATLSPIILRAKIDPYKSKVDYILIDCAPSLGVLTVAAFTAADGVIVPCQTQYLSYTGLYKLKNTIQKVRARLNPTLEITAIFPTMYDARAKHDNEILEALRENYQDVLIDISVPMRATLKDSISSAMPIAELDPRSDGAKAYQRIAGVIDAKS
jgi:chromosome partitioning protein